MNWHFPNEDFWMANKLMNSYATSCLSRKMPVKARMHTTAQPLEWMTLQQENWALQESTRLWRDGKHTHGWWQRKLAQALWGTVWQCQLKPNTEWPPRQQLPSWVCSYDHWTHMSNKGRTAFIAPLLEQAKSPSTMQWIKPTAICFYKKHYRVIKMQRTTTAWNNMNESQRHNHEQTKQTKVGCMTVHLQVTKGYANLCQWMCAWWRLWVRRWYWLKRRTVESSGVLGRFIFWPEW